MYIIVEAFACLRNFSDRASELERLSDITTTNLISIYLVGYDNYIVMLLIVFTAAPPFTIIVRSGRLIASSALMALRQVPWRLTFAWTLYNSIDRALNSHDFSNTEGGYIYFKYLDTTR